MKETKFKNTEIGRIPEEWEVSPLVDLCLQITDGSHESPIEAEYGHYMPSVKDMYTNGFNFASCKKISEKDYQRLVNNGCKPQKGDVLIAKDGSILKYSFDLKEDLPIVLLSLIAIIRPCHSEIDSGYLALFFRQPMFIERVLANFKTGTGVPRIVLRNFEKIHISYPYDLTEQHHIASALTSIDNLISSLGKLIEKKKNIKQGTMQQLLTGQIHLKGFSEPWEEKKLEEVCSVKRGVRVVKRNLTTDGLYPVYQNTNFPLGYSNQYNVEANTPFVIIGGSAGQVGICRERYWAADDCAFFACHDIYKEYLYYVLLLNQSNILHNVRTGTIPRLDRSFLSNMVVYISSNIDEQQAIATILNKMDNEITALETKKTKYEAIKQGMMQQLLTGKIRLIS